MNLAYGHSCMSVSSRCVSLFLVCAALLLSFAAVPAWGQSTDSGTIIGVVTDQQNAAVVGAEVKLIDTATNLPRTTTTNENGRYVFANIPPGVYDLAANKAGFAQSKISGQKVTIGLTVTVNVTLKVGSNTETIEVKAGVGAELQVTNATVGRTISFASLIDLPNIGRDTTTLLTLQPAVHPNGSVAGAVRDQNTFQLDGGNNTNDMDGTMNIYTPSYASNGTTTGVMPTPIESIEEFKVATTNQTADFNGSAGAQVQMVTRRGTSQVHGSAYEYYFGSNFGANTWLNNHTSSKDAQGNTRTFTPLPSTHRSRFGAAAGGPVLPSFLGGKWFIFGNYEGFRWPQNTTINKLVPTDLLKAGVIQVQNSGSGAAPVTVTVDGSPTVFPVGAWVPYNLNPGTVSVGGHTYAPANVCGGGSAACDPRGIGLNPIVGQIWSKFEPTGNVPSSGDGHNTIGYLTGVSIPQSSDFGVVRIDHDFGAKWHFMASYRYYRFSQLTTNQVDIGGALPGDQLGVAKALAPRPQKPSFYVIGLNTNITSNFTNDFHYNYLRNYWQWSTLAAPPQLPGLGGAVEIGGETSNALIPYNVNTQNARQRFWDGQDHTVRDDLSLIHGNHLLQFGGLYQRNFNYHQRNDNGNGVMNSVVYQVVNGGGIVMTSANRPAGLPSSQNGNWDLLYSEVLGLVAQPQVAYMRSGPNLDLQPLGTFAFDQSIIPTYNVYFSDTWHMRPTFTLTYGLGYTVEMPPFELAGKQVELVDEAGNLVGTEDYLARKKAAALKGQVYNPTLGFATVANVGKGLKYPYNPYYKGFSPRIAAAWNPRFDSGFLGHLFGNGHTVLRGGYSRIFGRLNGVDLVLVPLLGTGLMQAVQCVGALNPAAAAANGGNACPGTGGANPTTAFRIGTDGNSAPLPSVTATLPQPFYPGLGGSATAADGEVLDPYFKPNRSDQFDLTIQRELSPKMMIEFGYIGRKIKNEYQAHDLDAVPYMTTLGGQTYADAFGKVYTAICGLSSTCANNPASSVPVQPFFEAAMGGPTSAYCTGFSSCTVAVATRRLSDIKSTLAYNLWANLNNQVPGLSSTPGWVLGRTLPSSPAACAASSPIPANCVSNQFSAIFMNDSLGYGNYNAAFVSLTARDWHGLTALSNFTWSRSLGTGAVTQSTSAYSVVDPWDIHAMYGPQSFDIKFIYNLAFVYEPPFYKGQQGILGHLLGGWKISPLFTAQSGSPMTVGIQTGVNAACQSFAEMNCASGGTNENAVLIAPYTGGHSAHENLNLTGSIGVNANIANGGSGIGMFSDPASVYAEFRRMILGIDHSGNGAGVIRGLPTWNLDLTVTKEIRMTEQMGLQFISQFTNVFNHFQASNPSVTLDSPGSFGRITSQANTPRQMEFGLRFHF
jgi:hypothetical protein